MIMIMLILIQMAMMVYFKSDFYSIFLPINVGLSICFLFALIMYIYTWGKKKLFDVFSAIYIILIFVFMGVVTLILPGIPYLWLLLLAILIIAIAALHSYLSPKLQQN